MKAKTFKKNSARGENTCPSTATDEITSHLVTDELISQKNIGKESAARLTNQNREGMITLWVVVFESSSALCCYCWLYFYRSFFFFFSHSNHVSEQ